MHRSMLSDFRGNVYGNLWIDGKNILPDCQQGIMYYYGLAVFKGWRIVFFDFLVCKDEASRV